MHALGPACVAHMQGQVPCTICMCAPALYGCVPLHYIGHACPPLFQLCRSALHSTALAAPTYSAPCREGEKVGRDRPLHCIDIVSSRKKKVYFHFVSATKRFRAQSASSECPEARGS